MMSTYDSYAEAKIANPESEIFYAESQGFTRGDEPVVAANWVKCDPAGHCMTYEKFLADGHKFTDGDIYMNRSGELCHVMNAQSYNHPLPGDEERYVIFSKALNETKSDIQPQFKNGDTAYDTDGNQYTYATSHPLLPDTSILLDSIGELKATRTSKLTTTPQVTPKDGEWWMCEVITDETTVTRTTGNVLLYKNDNWVNYRDYLNVKPLYRMIRDTE